MAPACRKQNNKFKILIGQDILMAKKQDKRLKRANSVFVDIHFILWFLSLDAMLFIYVAFFKLKEGSRLIFLVFFINIQFCFFVKYVVYRPLFVVTGALGEFRTFY